MDELTPAQRKYLRGLAHHLRPVAQVGQSGVTDAFLANLDGALASHELVKVKFADWKDRKAELSDEICDRLDCWEAGRVGHVVILYRPAREPEKRSIRLPGSRDRE